AFQPRSGVGQMLFLVVAIEVVAVLRGGIHNKQMRGHGTLLFGGQERFAYAPRWRSCGVRIPDRAARNCQRCARRGCSRALFGLRRGKPRRRQPQLHGFVVLTSNLLIAPVMTKSLYSRASARETPFSSSSNDIA